MKTEFFTITIGNECFDLPKDMVIPSKGDVVFIGNTAGTVDFTHYHISSNRKVFMVQIYATKV